MEVRDFTKHPQVLTVIAELNQQRVAEKGFSDIRDASGFQYVDLVMEGGGVLGIALTGYVYVLEQMNLRFLQLGGTSAGSINALLMAAAGKANEKKTSWILEKLSNKNLADFIDGDDDARDFVKVLLEEKKTVKTLWKAWQVIDNFTEDFGLNPGNKFLVWLKGLLSEKGINTVRELEMLRRFVPEGMYHLTPDQLYEPNGRLALVAADVTTSTKVVFPEMAGMYFADPENINPAEMVRASMSIPFFFHPYRVKNIPKTAKAAELWAGDMARYSGKIPDEVFFIDGGIMSNFPIDLFHKHLQVPKCPTFGVKLGVDRKEPNKIEKFPTLIGSIFDAARNVHDFDFIRRNPDYKHLVSYIKIGDHNWLDFYISEEAKIDLFIRGAQSAADFLKKFNWQQYKKIREESLKVFHENKVMNNLL